jgi:hypothetical protein
VQLRCQPEQEPGPRDRNDQRLSLVIVITSSERNPENSFANRVIQQNRPRAAHELASTNGRCPSYCEHSEPGGRAFTVGRQGSLTTVCSSLFNRPALTGVP